MRVGRSIAVALARRGPVAIHHHQSVAGAQDTLDEIGQAGGVAHLFQADLRDPDQCRRLVREVLAWGGSLEVLVNSAAVFFDEEMSLPVEESWRLQSSVNLLAPYILSMALAEHLQDGVQGSIINLLDARLARPAGDHLLYRLTKAALAHLTHCLAVELAPRVRVNGIGPGALLPPNHESEAEMAERLSGEIPLGLPSTRSVASTIHYLLDECFVTGQIIHLDGGQYL